MKKIIFPILALLLITGSSCQEKNDIEKEKEAIIKVLYEEGEKFAANDLEGLSSLYIQDELTTRYSVGGICTGWDEIRNLYESYVEYNTQDSAWVNPRNTKENINLKVTGNTAWLICDNIWDYEFNNKPQGFVNIQIAFFEKIDGEWKFSFDAFVPKPKKEVEEGEEESETEE